MADYYVDFSATNDGTGASHSQAASPGAAGAYNTLASKTFSSGDKVWIRRVIRSGDYTADITFGNAGVIFIGWPESGDEHYAARPGGAQGDWDGDGADHAEFSFDSTSFELNVTANSVEMHRLKVRQKAQNADAIVYSTNTGVKHYNCYFINQHASGVAGFVVTTSSNTGFVYRGCTFEVTLSVMNSATANILCIYGSGSIVESCAFILTTATPSGAAYILGCDAPLCYIANITCTIGTMSGSAGTGILNIGSLCLGSYFINIAGTCTTNNNTLSNYAMIVAGSGNVIKGFSCNFGKGVSITSYGNVIDITSMTQRHANTVGSILFGSGAYGNQFSIANTTFISGNTTGDIVLNGENNEVLARNCVYNAASPFTISGGHLNRWYSFDHNGTLGNYQHGAKGGTLIASNTSRDTGEAFSMKFEMNGNTVASKGELMLSRKGAETIWLALSSGARTVTIYGAHKNYTSIKAHDIWAELDYTDASDVVIQATTYGYNTALTSDSSTWTGDSGLTMFKLVFSFTLPADQIVPVRMYGTKYEGSAYVYIDPKPVIT